MAETRPSERRDAWRVKDARGRLVTQLDPVMMHWLRRPGAIPPERLEAIAREIGIGTKRRTRGLYWTTLVTVLIGGACLIFALGLAISGTAGLGEFMDRVFPIAVALYIFLSMTLQVVRQFPGRDRQIRKVMLKHRRCPHCGYDLRLLPAASEDRATVCPECGCAWKLEDVQDDRADEAKTFAD